MKNKKLTGILMIVIGVILLALSLLADVIGLGGASGFGWKQILGSVVGAAAVVAGLILALKK
jgi:hypothetical protein